MHRKIKGACVDAGGYFAETGPGRMYVRDEGLASAPPILLLHGFTGSMNWFDGVAADLTDRFRVIRVDLRGHGRTGGHDGLDAPDQALAVAAVLDRLAVPEVVAVGHSFGADVALALAAQRGGVTRVVILGQGPDYGCATKLLRPLLRAPQSVAAAAHALLSVPMLAGNQPIAFAPGFRPGPELQALIARDHLATDPATYRIMLHTRRSRLANRPLDRQIHDLAVPTLAIHGRQDRMFACDITCHRYAAIGASIAILEHTGHSANLEKPRRVAQLIADFATTG